MTEVGAGHGARLGESAEDQAFRLELRRFFEQHHPGAPPRERAERLAWQRDWVAFLVDEGYAGPAWPRAFGGMELPLVRQMIYHDEAAAARIPRHPCPNVFTVGPTIIRHGSDAQRGRFLRPMLRGEELWAQGFSEPEAGSDLPALRTRAERDGEEYVVTGQKVWSTNAHLSDWMFALVRTGPAEARQAGITYLLMDLRADGVSIRPIRDMADRTDFCEVFLDGVRVPIDNRVGDENAGWAVARTSLGHERSAGALVRASRYRSAVAELVQAARSTGALANAVQRRRLIQLEVDARLLELGNMRLLAATVQHGEPGPLSSVTRLAFATFEQTLHEVAVDLLGASGLLAHSDPHLGKRGRWTAGFLRTRASTIGAGTTEIQRNTIAERVLGLPRDPGMPG